MLPLLWRASFSKRRIFASAGNHRSLLLAAHAAVGDDAPPRRLKSGVNVFGGGLALYATTAETLVGAVGVSWDTSCADHNISWRTRHTLNLDFVPAGVSGDATHPDNIVYDITNPTGFPIGVSAGGWGHPVCSAASTKIAGELPAVQ